MSMFTRVLAGLTGALILIMVLFAMYRGDFSFLQSGHGRYGLLMPFLPIVFIAYAVGGQSLLRKYLPFLAEKDKTTNVDESDKK